MSDDHETPAGGELAAASHAPVGFVTQVRDRGLPPALLAEQQRAKSEIEAALTIAQARPRDEKEVMDKILVSCQRPGLAAKSQYQYARGGTDISGPSIRLLEAIAQRWGNIEFGWRELSRFPGVSGKPGQSVVEAFAWDLQSNTRPRVQFTVEHQIPLKGGRSKILTDSRDIFEYISNQVMRRVRKCLEGAIPRDVVEAACEECDRTLKAEIKDLGQAAQKMVVAFGELEVTKEQIEARIQRRIESITAAQVIALRKIYTSIRDGISEATDWFEATKEEGLPPTPSPLQEAKERMRQAKASAEKQREQVAPEPAPQEAKAPPVAPEPEAPKAAEPVAVPPAEAAKLPLEIAALVSDYQSEAQQAETLTGLRELRRHAEANTILQHHPAGLAFVAGAITAREEAIKKARLQERKAQG